MDDINSPEKEKLISFFTTITSSSREVAISVLEAHKWNLYVAVSTFMSKNEVAVASAEPNVPNPSDEHLGRRNQTPIPNLRIDIPSTSDDSSDYPPSRFKRHPDVGTSRTFADFSGGSNETLENDGGEDNRDIERPEQSSRSMPAEPVLAELQEVITNTVTIWRNGYTINDGPLNTLDDPVNAAFHMGLSWLDAPLEVSQVVRYQVKLIRREEEYFTESQAPFHGVGRTLAGSDSASTEPPALAASPSMRDKELERPAKSPRLMSEETVSAELQEQQQQDQSYQVVTVTIWKNGFTVDDSPLKTLDDPENAASLEMITSLESPRQLGPVRIKFKLIKRGENFGESPSFQGVGRTLDESDSVFSEPQDLAASQPSSTGLLVDHAAPTTSIKLRLADGTLIITQFNTHHTVRDVRGFIDASRPDDSRDYQLFIMGFPPTPLSDFNQTIEKAGIPNSVIIQKF